MNLNSRYNFPILLFFIIVVNLIAYYPSLNSYFVNDDYNWIKPVPFSEVISSLSGGWGHGALFRPLTRFLLYAEFLIFKESPTGFHLISILLHSTSIFIFLILINTFFNDKLLIYFIVFAVIFFYPFHEVVCWISTQTILLGTNFIFLSLLFFSFSLKNNKMEKFYFISLIFYLLALSSYELSLIVPLLCVLSIYVIGNESNKNLKHITYLIFPFLLLAIIYLIYRKIVLAGLPEANEYTANLYNWMQNFLKLLNHQFLRNGFLLILVVIGAIYFLYIRRIRYLYFAISWFFIGYLPFLFVNGYTGRFAYFSMYGIVFIIGAFAKNIYEKSLSYKIIITIIFVSYIFFNAYKQYQNSVYWYEAGEISRTIPLQLKSLHSIFPDNSTLIFYDIPLGYHESGVYLTYFEDAIQKQYVNKLNIIHVSHPFNKNFNDSLYIRKPNVYKFSIIYPKEYRRKVI